MTDKVKIEVCYKYVYNVTPVIFAYVIIAQFSFIVITKFSNQTIHYYRKCIVRVKWKDNFFIIILLNESLNYNSEFI